MALKASLLAFAAASLQPVKFECPEIKEEIYVKKMNLGEREAYIDKIQKAEKDIPAIVMIEGVCDKDGNNVFTDEDLPDINKLPQELASKIIDLFAITNGFRADPNKAVEEAEKNSEAA